MRFSLRNAVTKVKDVQAQGLLTFNCLFPKVMSEIISDFQSHYCSIYIFEKSGLFAGGLFFFFFRSELFKQLSKSSDWLENETTSFWTTKSLGDCRSDS